MDVEKKLPVPHISKPSSVAHGPEVVIPPSAIESKSIITVDEEKGIPHDERPAAFEPLWKEIIIVGLCCCASITQVHFQNKRPSSRPHVNFSDISGQFRSGRFVDVGTRL
jgi:hypothetical protein